MTLKTVLTKVLLCGLASTAAFAAEPNAEDKLADAGFELMKTDHVGGLRIGLAGTEVLKLLSCPVKKGKDRVWGADGGRHQAWSFPGCGVELDMVSDTKSAPKTVGMITVEAPFAGATRRGIQIGSTAQAVEKAYKTVWNKPESEANVTFVAGSVYGGMIFHLNQGRVEKIFIGAAAE